MVSPSIATDIQNFLLFVDNPLVSLVDEDSAANEYLATTTGEGVGSGTGMAVGTDVGPTTMVGIERVTSALSLALKVGVGSICVGAAPEQANSPTPINTTRKVANRMFAASITKP